MVRYTTYIQVFAIMWRKSSVRTHFSSFVLLSCIEAWHSRRDNHPQVQISFFAFTWWFTNIFSISFFFQTQCCVKPQYIKLLRQNVGSMMFVRSQCIMLTSKTKKKEQWGFVMNTEIWNQCYRWQLQASLSSVSNLSPFVGSSFFNIVARYWEILVP